MKMPKLKKDDFCLDCKMPLKINQYHPYAACLMFKQCHHGQTVTQNLAAVLAYARKVKS